MWLIPKKFKHTKKVSKVITVKKEIAVLKVNLTFYGKNGEVEKYIETVSDSSCKNTQQLLDKIYDAARHEYYMLYDNNEVISLFYFTLGTIEILEESTKFIDVEETVTEIVR